MSWMLIVHAPPEELEVAAASLFDLGALGVELQDPEMVLMPGTPPLPEGRGRCIAHFDDELSAREAGAVLADESGGRYEVPAPAEVAAQDWSTAWRSQHKPLRIGPRSWVVPPWEKSPAGEGEVAITIDPGLAFGTGAHATTGLCLTRVDELCREHPGLDLLDVGTGSGIILLLAAKLDAGRLCGTENDPIALRVAAEGAALNGFGPERISWQLADPDQLAPPHQGPYPLVVANILLNTLVELAPKIASAVAPGGRLLLSGLLAHQGEEAQAAYVAQGLSPAGLREREGWLLLELVRR